MYNPVGYEPHLTSLSFSTLVYLYKSSHVYVARQCYKVLNTPMQYLHLSSIKGHNVNNSIIEAFSCRAP